jgi:hypothetical protein
MEIINLSLKKDKKVTKNLSQTGLKHYKKNPCNGCKNFGNLFLHLTNDGKE